MESITNDVVIHKKIISNQKKNINDIKEAYTRLKQERKGEWKSLFSTNFDQYSFINGTEQETTIFRHDKKGEVVNKKRALICFDGSGVDSENILKRISKNNSVSFTNSRHC